MKLLIFLLISLMAAFNTYAEVTWRDFGKQATVLEDIITIDGGPLSINCASTLSLAVVSIPNYQLCLEKLEAISNNKEMIIKLRKFYELSKKRDVYNFVLADSYNLDFAAQDLDGRISFYMDEAIVDAALNNSLDLGEFKERFTKLERHNIYPTCNNIDYNTTLFSISCVNKLNSLNVNLTYPRPLSKERANLGLIIATKADITRKSLGLPNRSDDYLWPEYESAEEASFAFKGLITYFDEPLITSSNTKIYCELSRHQNCLSTFDKVDMAIAKIKEIIDSAEKSYLINYPSLRDYSFTIGKRNSFISERTAKIVFSWKSSVEQMVELFMHYQPIYSKEFLKIENYFSADARITGPYPNRLTKDRVGKLMEELEKLDNHFLFKIGNIKMVNETSEADQVINKLSIRSNTIDLILSNSEMPFGDMIWLNSFWLDHVRMAQEEMQLIFPKEYTIDLHDANLVRNFLEEIEKELKELSQTYQISLFPSYDQPLKINFRNKESNLITVFTLQRLDSCLLFKEIKRFKEWHKQLFNIQ